MTTIVPGALWHPIDVGNREPRRKGRGIAAHVAVASSHCLVPAGTPAARSADWTFYLPKTADPAGRFFQFIDLDLQCWASAVGNATLPAWESEGGLGTAAQVNAEPWTDNQLESGAIILAFLNETEGTPLQVMPDSLPASRGLAPHRLGIDPWRVAGGEVWSSSTGKLCPGDAKIAQLPTIVGRAVELRHGSPTPTPQPPPAAIPPRLTWNLGAGNYYGNIAGPAVSHGGFNAGERPFVRNIQQWLIYHGCVAGVHPAVWPKTAWADGRWEAATDTAMALWHSRFYPGQPKPAQCWSDDYARLAR